MTAVDWKQLEQLERRRATDRARHARNREAVNARRRAARAENVEAAREKARAYYAEHAVEIMQRQREVLEDMTPVQREVRRAQQAQWARESYDRYREERRAAATAWRAAHLAEDNARRQEAKKDNRARGANDAALRRARQRTAGPVERIRREDIWLRDAGVCHLCGSAADPANWHLDHVTPIAAGGTHTADNVAVSHPACNQSKGGRVR